MDVVEVVILAVVGHRLAIEQSAEDLSGLGEAGFADRWRVEWLADGGILSEGVSCSDPNFEPASAQMVQAGQFLGQMDRVVEVIVQDKGAEADARRAVGNSHRVVSKGTTHQRRDPRCGSRRIQLPPPLGPVSAVRLRSTELPGSQSETAAQGEITRWIRGCPVAGCEATCS